MRALPHTYLAKGKYWRFRHPKTGDCSLDGEPFGRDFINHYRALLARVGLSMKSVGADKVLRSNEVQANYTRLYFMGIEPAGPVKIGITYDITRRLRHIQMACPYEVSLIADFPGSRSIEAELHRRFAAHRMKGEWFNRVDEIMDEIDRLKGENNG